MFFSNKTKVNECLQLQQQIEELKKELSQNKLAHANELEKITENFQNKIETLEKKNNQINKIAKFTTSEGIVAVDNHNNLIFMNEKAESNIPNKNELLKVISSKNERIIIADCEAKLTYKKYDDFTVVSLIKTSIHDNAEDGLLHKHNNNINVSLSNTQVVYQDLLSELDNMAKESKSTANGSMEGLTLTQNIVKDTVNLNNQIVTENEIVTNLVQKSKDRKSVV